MTRICLLITAVVVLAQSPAEAAGTTLSATTINGATFAPLPHARTPNVDPRIIRAEVLLDRARFSPGSIDGIDGDNFRKAVSAYQSQMHLPVTGIMDLGTWTALTSRDTDPAIVERTITERDTRGPFASAIPVSFEKQATLKHMAYRNVPEELAEQYHTSRALLLALNRGVIWSRTGAKIIAPMVRGNRPSNPSVTRVDVDKRAHDLWAYAADGSVVAFYPASIGSTEKPAPSGRFAIRRVVHNPEYTYNPKYEFKGVTTTHSFTIAPGPNNPVGSVWIDLSFEGYGIHGTPDPDLVGKTQSHGCIRLTNWDAQDLASLVSTRTIVNFLDGPPAGTIAGSSSRPLSARAQSTPTSAADTPLQGGPK